MTVTVQTLAGVLQHGDTIVALLLAPTEVTCKMRLGHVASNPEQLTELFHAINDLRANLRVLALDTVEVNKAT